MPPKKATTSTTSKPKTTTGSKTTTTKPATKKTTSTTKKTTTASKTGKKQSIKTQDTNKQENKEEAKKEEPQEQKEEEKQEDVTGKATITYNHYKSSFPTLNEQMKFTDIDEEYAISFVFEGNFGVHLQNSDGQQLEQKSYITDKLDDDGKPIKETIFYKVQNEQTYKLIVVEDEEAEAQRENVGYKAPEQDKEEKRGEGCSCIFGNPCQDKYVCLDWNNREAVAKKNGWKGFS